MKPEYLQAAVESQEASSCEYMRKVVRAWSRVPKKSRGSLLRKMRRGPVGVLFPRAIFLIPA